MIEYKEVSPRKVFYGGCYKNSKCRSERSEESHTSLLKPKERKREPLDIFLRITRKGKLKKFWNNLIIFWKEIFFIGVDVSENSFTATVLCENKKENFEEV